MIIACPNCNKKFKIDPTLIPEDGRDLKCGSCNHVWLYKVEDVSSIPLALDENVDNNEIEPDNTEKKKDIELFEATLGMWEFATKNGTESVDGLDADANKLLKRAAIIKTQDPSINLFMKDLFMSLIRIIYRPNIGIYR